MPDDQKKAFNRNSDYQVIACRGRDLDSFIWELMLGNGDIVFCVTSKVDSFLLDGGIKAPGALAGKGA